MNLPRIIHQCWIDPSGTGQGIPGDVEHNCKEWKRLHPDFELIVWGSNDLPRVLADVAGINVWAHVEKCRLHAMKSDLIRLALLYQLGGVWSDLKNLPLKSFLEDLIASKMPIFSEHPPMPNRPMPTGYICNAFIVSCPEDEFIKACIEHACHRISQQDESGVFAVTGGGLIMRIQDRFMKAGSDGIRTVLHYQNTWNVLMRRTAAGYNAGDKHWSVMQKNGSLYIETPNSEQSNAGIKG